MEVFVPALPESFLERVRSWGIEDLGQPARHLVEVAERWLGRANVAFVEARFAVFDCFACRIERSGEGRTMGFRYSEPVTALAGVAA